MTGKTVKDVSPHEFVKAYAAHLKRSGKVESHDYKLLACILLYQLGVWDESAMRDVDLKLEIGHEVYESLL